ncbi:SCP2 sterol-binding domain-containing protein [Wenzhouxiangella sp. AB-CW3]|uniref:ubiquinone biosynthesis accessory factor UbiJ n=1 Tax=Wenzhouxiangella sp. AB-CW3 TaxID=2771012 RepID=UPI00168ADDF4|nr:SCP2 sterol-binding domain-containing protein [Wenzhouxiangella sp. AB-CW3]QOC23210.1 SCP2 sterol-binding domain-containing protein [Wenzhouxiangella sp. AB-CW3]
MSRYLTPLPGLLARAIDTALARALQLDPRAADRLATLKDQSVRLELKGLGIDLFFTGSGEALSVSTESDVEPDTTISGTPAALLAMAVPDWRAPGSGVQIQGNAGTAQALEKLLRQLDPDWESLLVEHLGPVWGHQVWRMLQDSMQRGRHMAGTAADQTARFLREESGLLVRREEVEEFTVGVDELREAVDRLEARLRRERRP